MRRSFLAIVLILWSGSVFAGDDSLMMRRISDHIMLHGQCYNDLRVLCKDIGNRLSATPEAEQAVQWGKKVLEEAGADRVWLQPVMVPHWHRGQEHLALKYDGQRVFEQVKMTSLGNTVGTDGKILDAAIIMVQNFEEFEQLSEKEVRNKIVFFNYRFRQDLIHTFAGYSDAGPYRWKGPSIASRKGAAGVIIRSVSTGLDNAPHTGSLRYAYDVKPIPAVAIGNTTADRLEKECRKGAVRAQLQSDCKMMEDVLSYNVIGEIKGSEHPEEIVLVCGHLDSWDLGDGAHDDGSGCVQSIEVIRAFKEMGIRPKRTIRAVLFMNEENGLKGGYAYADSAKSRNEQHILGIESDAGGFSPRGFSLDMSEERIAHIMQFQKYFIDYGVYDFTQRHGGADITPIHRAGMPAAGLLPDVQRYFDLHHTENDVFEKVNHRELKLGAVVMTQLVYLISEHGLK